MFKFLDPTGATYRNGEPFYYNLPGPGQKWATTMHPEPVEPDGKACGAGRIHLMRNLSATYAPPNWWPWWAVPIGEMDSDSEKVSAAGCKLRRISPRVLARALRPPFNWGMGADLRSAYLRSADLRSAYLRSANLRSADLYGANLSGADLSGADLSGADLSGADLEAAIMPEGWKK
jgi:hypothetical protein